VAAETMIERIDPPGPGGPPYSGLVVAGPLVFVAGQVGSGPRTGAVPAGIKAQTQVVLSNIEAKLKKAGCGLKDVVKSTVFLADIRGFEGMNEVYRAAFAPHFPARSTIEARRARSRRRRRRWPGACCGAPPSRTGGPASRPRAGTGLRRARFPVVCRSPSRS